MFHFDACTRMHHACFGRATGRYLPSSVLRHGAAVPAGGRCRPGPLSRRWRPYCYHPVVADRMNCFCPTCGNLLLGASLQVRLQLGRAEGSALGEIQLLERKVCMVCAARSLSGPPAALGRPNWRSQQNVTVQAAITTYTCCMSSSGEAPSRNWADRRSPAACTAVGCRCVGVRHSPSSRSPTSNAIGVT